MKSRWKRLAIVFCMILLLAACGTKPTTSAGNQGKEKEYTIGITQIMEHPALNAAQSGFKKALEDAGLNVTYDSQNAQGDNSANTSIAKNLVSADVDLIFANSTPSAQAALSATSEIPIIFTSVTDPVGAELVKNLEKPGTNATGTMDAHPEAINKTLTFMKEEMEATTIGTIYNVGEQNSRAQVNNVKQIANELGMELKEAAVATTADVKQAAESLADQVDAFYIVTDNTVVAAIEAVVSVANQIKKPLFTADLDSLERGAFAAFGFDYFDIGYEAGEMAVKVLQEEAVPEVLDVQPPQTLRLKINKEAAATIEVEVKPEWNAEFVDK